MEKIQINGAQTGIKIDADGNCWSAQGRKLPVKDGYVSIKLKNGRSEKYLVTELKDVYFPKDDAISDAISLPVLNPELAKFSLEALTNEVHIRTMIKTECLTRLKVQIAEVLQDANTDITIDDLTSVLMELKHA